MGVFQDRLRNIQVSTALQETAYDTAVAVDSLIKVNAGIMAQEMAEISDDRDLISGSEEADDSTVLAQHVEIPLAQSKCRPHTLAFIAGFAMGKVLTSAVGATVRKHHFTPVTAHTSLPAFTLEGLIKTGLQYKYSGMFVDSFELAVSRGADRRVSISSQCYGSGTRATGSAANVEYPESALNAATAAVWLGATTYAGTIGDGLSLTTSDLTSPGTAVSPDLVNFTWNYKNNVDLDFLYEIGGGLGPNLVVRTAREQSFAMTLLFNSDAEVTALLAGTNMAFQLVVRGDQEDAGPPIRYEGFSLVVPILRYRVANRQEQNGRLLVAVEAFPLQSVTYGSVILDVFTKKTAYMA